MKNYLLKLFPRLTKLFSVEKKFLVLVGLLGFPFKDHDSTIGFINKFT